MSAESLEQALRLKERQGGSLALNLVLTGAVDDEVLAAFYEERFRMPRLTEAELVEVGAEALKVLPSEIIYDCGILPIRPLGDEGGRMLVGVLDPMEPEELEEASFFAGLDLVPRLMTVGQLARHHLRLTGRRWRIDPETIESRRRTSRARQEALAAMEEAPLPKTPPAMPAAPPMPFAPAMPFVPAMPAAPAAPVVSAAPVAPPPVPRVSPSVIVDDELLTAEEAEARIDAIIESTAEVFARQHLLFGVAESEEPPEPPPPPRKPPPVVMAAPAAPAAKEPWLRGEETGEPALSRAQVQSITARLEALVAPARGVSVVSPVVSALPPSAPPKEAYSHRVERLTLPVKPPTDPNLAPPLEPARPTTGAAVAPPSVAAAPSALMASPSAQARKSEPQLVVQPLLSARSSALLGPLDDLYLLGEISDVLALSPTLDSPSEPPSAVAPSLVPLSEFPSLDLEQASALAPEGFTFLLERASPSVVEQLSAPMKADLRALDQALERDEVGLLAARFLRRCYQRVLLLTCKNNLATAWVAALEGEEPKVIHEELWLEVQEVVGLERAMRERVCYVGPLFPSGARPKAADVQLRGLLQGGLPRSALLCPVLVKGHLLAVCYADEGAGQAVSLHQTAMGALAQRLDEAFRRVILLRKSQRRSNPT